METMIYGAKSLALGAYKAMSLLYPERKINGFLVSSLENNPEMLAGIPVTEIGNFADKLTESQKDDICVYVATPEDVHSQILDTVKKYGFKNVELMCSEKEAELMGKYFEKIGLFPSVHNLDKGNEFPNIKIFKIKFFKDKSLKNKYEFPDWVHDIQVGADLTDQKVAYYRDNMGDNISSKNGNYCEMTAYYWLWKSFMENDNSEYYGFYHYRRCLDITEDDLKRIKLNSADVVLPYPTLHEPDIKEHHTRYVKETDWETMLSVLKELYPDYYAAYEDIFSREYFYNYNMMIAKRTVMREYCEWLFPLLKRVEETSIPKGSERADRYTAYMSESLTTLYFIYNRDRLKIYHTGRRMLV
ncbi:MAG: DUF4422 domain-containing protein [Oscillospiraceae bacterium]|nr:DUF4422 domain-containing protein [Oscillospiraceae bacterium]